MRNTVAVNPQGVHQIGSIPAPQTGLSRELIQHDRGDAHSEWNDVLPDGPLPGQIGRSRQEAFQFSLAGNYVGELEVLDSECLC